MSSPGHTEVMQGGGEREGIGGLPALTSQIGRSMGATGVLQPSLATAVPLSR
jgi:hypothetical protein